MDINHYKRQQRPNVFHINKGNEPIKQEEKRVEETLSVLFMISYQLSLPTQLQHFKCYDCNLFRHSWQLTFKLGQVLNLFYLVNIVVIYLSF